MVVGLTCCRRVQPWARDRRVELHRCVPCAQTCVSLRCVAISTLDWGTSHLVGVTRSSSRQRGWSGWGGGGWEGVGGVDGVRDYCDFAGWPTAAGQGALAVEVVQSTGASPRPSRLRKLNEALARLDHAATRATVSAERWVLAGLEAGCQAPLGVTAFLEDGLLFLSATVYSSDGAQRITSSHAAT